MNVNGITVSQGSMSASSNLSKIEKMENVSKTPSVNNLVEIDKASLLNTDKSIKSKFVPGSDVSLFQGSSDLIYEKTFEPSETIIEDGTKIEYYESSIKNFTQPENLTQVNVDINGIMNGWAAANETRKKIEEISGKDIQLVHNKTHSAILDGVEAVADLLNADILGKIVNNSNKLIPKPKENKAEIQTNMEKFFQSLNKKPEDATEKEKMAAILYTLIKMDYSPRVMAHSQGAAITADALNIVREQLLNDTHNLAETQTKMASMSVLTIGGFASRGDFPDEVSLVKIENVLSNKEGRDPVSYISNANMSILGMGNKQLDLEKNVVLAHINQDPSRSKLEKAFLTRTINDSVDVVKATKATGKFTLALINTFNSIIPTAINTIKNKDGLVEHRALSGYLDKKIVANEVNKFFN